MTIIKIKVLDLRAGDVIVKKSGEDVRITGIANKPKGKRTLVIEHAERVVLDLDYIVERMEAED